MSEQIEKTPLDRLDEIIEEAFEKHGGDSDAMATMAKTLLRTRRLLGPLGDYMVDQALAQRIVRARFNERRQIKHNACRVGIEATRAAATLAPTRWQSWYLGSISLLEATATDLDDAIAKDSAIMRGHAVNVQFYKSIKAKMGGSRKQVGQVLTAEELDALYEKADKAIRPSAA